MMPAKSMSDPRYQETGEETCDELRDYSLLIRQPRNGYRYSLDPLLLCDFAGADDSLRIADLGTGCGIIPMVMARRWCKSQIVGIELHSEMAAIASRNVEINNLSPRISIINADILELQKILPAASFDLIVANPPYREMGSGRISPRPGRDAARHELTAKLADFMAVARRLVINGGRICFIYHTSRLVELMDKAVSLKLTPMRLRMVHGDRTSAARMFLIELVKGRLGELSILPPLYLDTDCSCLIPAEKG